MPKYEVQLLKPLWTTVTVNADDPEDAIEKAFDSDQVPPGMCAQCGGWGREWSIDDDNEWDVPPRTIEEARAFVTDKPVRLVED